MVSYNRFPRALCFAPLFVTLPPSPFQCPSVAVFNGIRDAILSSCRPILNLLVMKTSICSRSLRT